MKALSTMTDEQRVSILNHLLRTGLNTPKHQLPFGAEKLTYVMPFIGKLQQDAATDLASRFVVRQIVDDLLQEIADEMVLNYSTNESLLNRKMVEFGIASLMNNESALERKVA